MYVIRDGEMYVMKYVPRERQVIRCASVATARRFKHRRDAEKFAAEKAGQGLSYRAYVLELETAMRLPPRDLSEGGH